MGRFSRGTAAAVGLTVAAVGIVPFLVARSVAEDYGLAIQLEYFMLMLRLNPIGILLGLLAAIPYVLGWQGLVHQRFLTYTRCRSDLRRTLLRAYAHCALVTGVTFGGTVLGLYGLSLLTEPVYRPEIYEGSPARSAATITTFSQVTVWGEWLYPVVIAVWIGAHAIGYAWLALTTTLLVTNRALALSLPWAASLVIGFGMAVAGLESYSPFTATPFDLTQLPVWKPVLPFAGLVVLAVAAAAVTVWRSSDLPRLQ